MPPVDESLTRIATSPLAIVTGKGGVGKSVVTAALARLMSDGGRALALDLDPRESLFECFGVEPSGGVRVRVGPSLSLEHVDAHRLIEAFARDHVRVPWVTHRLTSSRVFHHFVDAAPGLKEVALLGHAARMLGRGTAAAFDRVVIDAPATGHALALVDAPRLVSRAIEAGPFATLSRDIAAVVADPAQTAIVVVAHAEVFAVDETREFAEELSARLGRPPTAIIVNAVYPPWPNGRRLADRPDALALWSARAATKTRELERLSQWWRGPLFVLPLVPLPRGPALVDTLARRLRDRREVRV